MIARIFLKIARHSGWGALFIGSLFVFVWPPVAGAHVNWFVSEEAIASKSISSYSFSEVIVWVVLIGMVVLLTKAALLEWKTQDILHRKKIEAKLTQWRPRALRIFQIFLGLSLLGCAGQKALFASHFRTGEGMGDLLILGLEAGAGFLILLNLAVPVASGVLLLLYGILIAQWGPLNALEYINMAGIAIFLGLMKASVTSPLHRYKAWAVPVLRVSTGMALIILAFSEKLLNPIHGVALLEMYSLNFMPLLGFAEFNDRLFILAAGATETVLGLIFILGWIPRLNTVALAGFFIASNFAFFALGFPREGWEELIGHLPVLGTALILLTYGAGEKMKLHLSRVTQE